MSLAEAHISSLLVQVSPEHLEETKGLIAGLKEAEIYGVNEVGKIVVVLETQTEGFISEIIEQINDMPGVLGATMVYHQIDVEPNSKKSISKNS
ncbi:chaperone NapD [uncultured Shewanella sp.]|uniref:chaperone NapD n=1 Tax=Shewanella atlantica TaxID=271099 RepID=UPI0026073963|nr:chaperone NapD [uncultured Shewanella sp.]